MSASKIAVLPGDGIGLEVTAEAVRVMRAIAKQSGASFEFEQGLVGGGAIDATGQPLPPETLKLCQGAHAILFGAVGGPKWDGLPQESKPERGLLGLRKGSTYTPTCAQPCAFRCSWMPRRSSARSSRAPTSW
jgi:3-isopropylmalate dehydrogenase